ncbi:MAG: TIM44-like domain-containing protein [Candidatus Sedimenticola sp. (ex Thyasira tokunagai)]
MHKFLTLLTLVCSTIFFAMMPLQDAEAKRFGFGKSFGKQSSWSRKAAPSRSTTTTSTGKQGAASAGAPRTSGASRWLGPLAGLAAGGLLASLFFGDAFDGIQPMDILLILGVVMAGMMLMRALARKKLQAAAGPVMSDNTAFRNNSFDHGGDARFSEEEGAAPGAGMDDVAPHDAPSWFAREEFIKGAKTHFIRLQAAWDKDDFKDIAEYTTPELYAEIQAERLSRGAERHFTEVVTLNADLEGVEREDDKVVASVRFSGLIREGEGSDAEEFVELWHVVHPWESATGDWHIAGIQQV